MEYPYQVKTLEEYHETYKNSVEKPEEFWANVAENFLWRKKWDKVLDWNFKEPKVEWFKGAKLISQRIVLTDIWKQWAKSRRLFGSQIIRMKGREW